MTNAEIKQRVLDHFKKQGQYAMWPTPYGVSCRYRVAESGDKCAIGCLIDDEHYDPAIEGRGFPTVKLESALQKSGLRVTVDNDRLLTDLQYLHDHSANRARPFGEFMAELEALYVP